MLRVSHDPPWRIIGGVFGSSLDYLHKILVALLMSGSCELLLDDVNFQGNEFALTTLHHQTLPQQICDLVFEKSFTISHNGKNGIVTVTGYTTKQSDVQDVLYPLSPACPSLVCVFTLPDSVDCDKQKGFIPEAHTKKMDNMKYESRQEKEGHGSQKVLMSRGVKLVMFQSATLPDYVDGDNGKELVVDELTKKMQARKLDSKEAGKKASGSGKVD